METEPYSAIIVIPRRHRYQDSPHFHWPSLHQWLSPTVSQTIQRTWPGLDNRLFRVFAPSHVDFQNVSISHLLYCFLIPPPPGAQQWLTAPQCRSRSPSWRVTCIGWHSIPARLWPVPALPGTRETPCLDPGPPQLWGEGEEGEKRGERKKEMTIKNENDLH